MKQGTKAKKMRRSKHCASNLSDAPTTICLRDREVTRRKIVLSKLTIKRRNNGPQDPLPPVVVTADSKRGRTRLRAEVDALTPRRRELSPVLRVGTACGTLPSTPPNGAPGPERQGSGDTPQGKRSKAAPLQLPADVCPAAQKSQMLRWKQQGLQVLNHHDQCANAQDLMVRELLSASTTMFFSFRRRSHAWILWANVEHGRQEYLFKWQAHEWLGGAEVAIAAMGAQEVMPGGKAL